MSTDSRQSSKADDSGGGESRLRAVHTPNFPSILRELGASIVVTTYQAGKVVLVRDEGQCLNTHFKAFQSPMGTAFAGDRLAIGTTCQIWEFHNVPAVAAKLEPPRRHDSCFLPRSCHVTGIYERADVKRGGADFVWRVSCTSPSPSASVDLAHLRPGHGRWSCNPQHIL